MTTLLYLQNFIRNLFHYVFPVNITSITQPNALNNQFYLLDFRWSEYLSETDAEAATSCLFTKVSITYSLSNGKNKY